MRLLSVLRENFSPVRRKGGGRHLLLQGSAMRVATVGGLTHLSAFSRMFSSSQQDCGGAAPFRVFLDLPREETHTLAFPGKASTPFRAFLLNFKCSTRPKPERFSPHFPLSLQEAAVRINSPSIYVLLASLFFYFLYLCEQGLSGRGSPWSRVVEFFFFFLINPFLVMNLPSDC